MAPKVMNLQARIETLNTVLNDQNAQQKIADALQEKGGNLPETLASLRGELPDATLQKVAFAHAAAEWTGDNVPVVKALAKQRNIASLRDVALKYSPQALAGLITSKSIPASINGDTLEERKLNFAKDLHNKLFATETSAVLQRMVQSEEIPVADAAVRAGVTSFLNNQPDFNIRTTSIYTALSQPNAFDGIADDQKSTVIDHVKTLQRIQAISPVAEAVPVLMEAKLASASQVTAMPESQFMAAFGPTLGAETARQVYTHAVNVHLRNEQALVAMRETLRGTGLAAIDGSQTTETRMLMMKEAADQKAIPINLDTLFGDLDYCECDECTSVYSAAAYFVELLQFLRNNNLGPDPVDPANPNPNIHPGIVGTPLEKLFGRRPDLGCLELTCENTNTILPYVDLVNEVMESFVVHLDEYHADKNDPKQANLEAFNVEGETSGELLAQPQHTNYDAYCILKNAVYPFTLPYHQPIDAQRIFLKYLGTSRYELLDTFRAALDDANASVDPASQSELADLHQVILDRAADAEFLGITQEEYIILTKQAFWSKRYFELTQKKAFSDKEYQKNIGVKEPFEYYGYESEKEMLDIDEGTGLTFVKKQFLSRTGILYTDLVELLKTQSINPNYPQGGKALTILESIRFSYRFLQTLVKTGSADPKIRFGKLIEALETYQKLFPLIEARLHPDPCHEHKTDYSLDSKDLRHWVYCDFENIGNLIVLESGDVPQLPIEGYLFVDGAEPVGRLNKDGTIIGKDGALISTVSIAGQPLAKDGQPFVNQFGVGKMLIKNVAGEEVGWLNATGLYLPGNDNRLNWLPPADNCDLDKVRLTHLNGTPLASPEYDCMQRFIRLWHKLGWSIDETDKALTGLHVTPAQNGVAPQKDGTAKPVDFEAFKDNCIDPETGEKCGCADAGDERKIDECPVSPEFLHQLVAVKKLLDLTGLQLIKLLTYWANISTVGEKSLYARLFLTHNLLGIDKVFQADTNGNYLTQSAKLTDHLTVLMAVLKLKMDDVVDLIKSCGVADELTLENVSMLYRHNLLAKALHVKISELTDVIKLFGDPFTDAYQALHLFKSWGNMEDAGFSFSQLNYLILKHDDPLRPLSPTMKSILQVAKTLFDGLNAIEHEHPDIPVDKPEEATSDLIRAKAALVFDQLVVEQIIGLLEGTTIYTTNAPANLKITIPDELNKKLKYNDQVNAQLQVTGILTAAEKASAKALAPLPEWEKAIERLSKKPLNFYNDVLYGVFKDALEPIENLLAGDIFLPADQLDPKFPDPNTAGKKRSYFLQYFMPFLRQQLTHRFVVSTMSGAAGLTGNVTDILLSEVLVIGDPPQSALTALEAIKNKPVDNVNGWKGYLIPSADGDYSFTATVKTGDPDPQPLLLDGQEVPFTIHQEDPSNVWSTDPAQSIKLKSGKPYWLEIKDQFAEPLQWKTAISPKSAIPSSALLPDFLSADIEDIFIKLQRAAMLVNGFGLSVEEIDYWHTHSADFDDFDFNDVMMLHWKRLQAYCDLRNNLPKAETTLLDLFKWASKPDDAAKLSEKIAGVTRWKKENIDKLLNPSHFDLSKPEAFRNEVNLVKLRKAFQVADKIGMDIDRLFEWAKPGSKFWECHQIAEDIRKAIQARFDQEDWEQVAKPLNDQLRENQKQALISYLLVQPDLKAWPVLDADSLFEFFLIDVQMDPCRETSRIVQAISSVQLFVQRCLLGLEESHGVPNSAIDRKRWEWMQKYRVWEANRKVFLYPENWIEGNLRDDKSIFYKDLESELLQKDINKQNVEDALKTYLYKVDEVANMEVVGVYIEEGNKLHVFSRTRNAPYFFYYRYLALDEMNWYPWEKMQVDIPSYDVEDSEGKITGNGCYLTPVVWNGRLFVFFPQFMKKTKPNENATNKVYGDMANDTPNNSKPTEYWEIKLAWSEYRNGKWTQKQLSKDTVWDIPTANNPAPAIASLAIDADKQAAKAVEAAQNVVDKTTILAPLDAEISGLTDQNANDAEAANKDIDDTVKEVAVATGLGGPPAGAMVALAKLPGIVNTIHNAKNAADTIKPKANEANNISGEANTKAGDAKKEADTTKSATAAIVAAFNIIAPIQAGIISNYEFVPIISDAENLLRIKVFYDQEEKGIFKFDGSNIATQLPNTYPGNNAIDVDSFHHNSSLMRSLQVSNDVENYKFDDGFETMYTYSTNDEINFHHPDAHRMLGTINSQQIEPFFRYYLDNTPSDMNDIFGNDGTAKTYNELKRPYSIYNWELFFHIPMLLGDAHAKAQNFEEAMRCYEYVFNPKAKGSTEKRTWQFSPFVSINARNISANIFNNLQPNQPNTEINNWRNNPFRPHVIARDRPVAYMKWVVMKYIKILIDYGDYYFRQNSLETIPLAIQCYVMAAHLYGPTGQKIPKRGKVKAETYNSLVDRWDAFSNAMVEMELVFPYSNQTPLPIGTNNGSVGLANVFGFATTLYFCIPDNPNLKEIRKTIDERLFNIRHCEDIVGIFRQLPLFEPPIDPGLLVQAAAQGLSISSVLNDLNSPMPNYRFYYLLQKALELCSELKALGNTFLSLKEKGDAEALSLLRARHESSIHNLVMEVKKKQTEEATKSIEALQQSRKGPVYRLQHFLKLIGEDLAKVPNDNTDFSELPNQIEQPVDESGLKLIPYEKEEMDKAHAAADWQTGIGIVETLASILHAGPNISANAEPYGVGTTISWGFPNAGNATQSIARGMQVYASILTHQSSNASRKGGFLRQLQDRVQQANIAGYEIKNIDKQILTQQIRIAIANLEITNQQKQIDNAQEVEEFLRNKYTNQELYIWMEGQIRTLYYQAYTLAYELAKKAEKAYRFERGLANSNFIKFGYWNTAYDGLLSGENLYLALKQLEAAYQEKRGYDYEISKPISLRQINPMALLQLRETGTCDFQIPEVLFDMDHPGHYMRRIKSVALTVPCVVGPYTSLNCTLRLLENKFRISGIAKDKNDYIEKTEEADDRFSTVNVPITSIAVSTGQNDSGVFELNFRDERYIPCEGAGVISKWRIELPEQFRQFDYNTISDIVMHVRYTAIDGGDELKSAAAGSVTDYVDGTTELSQKEGLFAVFDLVHDFPSEWYKAMHPSAEAPQRLMAINSLNDHLPVFTKGWPVAKIQATDIYLFTPSNLAAAALLLQGTDELNFTDSVSVGTMKSFASKDNTLPVGDWQLKIQDIQTKIEKLWMVVKYKLVN